MVIPSEDEPEQQEDDDDDDPEPLINVSAVTMPSMMVPQVRLIGHGHDLRLQLWPLGYACLINKGITNFGYRLCRH